MDEERARARFETALASYRQEFENFFLARLFDLGFEYEEELCRVCFPVEEFLFNPQGSLHGGAIATVMDISMGHLLKHMTGTGGATLEMKVQYMRPLTSGMATCEGRILRRGRSLCFLESRLFDEDGKLAAMATSTWKLPIPK